MTQTMVVLVDEHDVQVGVREKLQSHRDGVLHRACSVFVFDRAGRLLLQRRADGKYHSGGLWSNTCCGHPYPGEHPATAAHRRLREEMGFDCGLKSCGAFVYRAALGHGVFEHEYDHLFVGLFEGEPHPDPEEVGAWRWASIAAVRDEVVAPRHPYTAWFPLALARVEASLGRSLAPA